MSLSPLVKVEHVTYDYPGHRALDDVSFELPAASVTALVGPNGAGKTTLLRAMAALDEPMHGRIFVDGVNAWEEPRRAHCMMGYLPDHFGLYPKLTSHQCLTHAARSRGLNDDETQSAVRRAVEQVGLTAKLNDHAGTLSRGQRQRLALAQTLVHHPRLLLLDEPASGLDPQARADLADVMKTLAAEGMTLLISSHILAELESYCTAMLVLENGRLLAHQTLGGGSEEETRQKQILRVRLAREGDIAALRAWVENKGLTAKPADDVTLLVEGEFDESAQGELLRELLAARWPVLEFATQARNMQDTYLDVVGKQTKREQAQ